MKINFKLTLGRSFTFNKSNFNFNSARSLHKLQFTQSLSNCKQNNGSVCKKIISQLLHSRVPFVHKIIYLNKLLTIILCLQPLAQLNEIERSIFFIKYTFSLFFFLHNPRHPHSACLPIFLQALTNT